jgi:hypothetical protein
MTDFGPKDRNMTYEDRLRVWTATLSKGMAYWNGRGLLIPVRQAVEELNGCLDLGRQMRAAQLKRIVAEFKDTAPPYSSFDLKTRAANRRAVGTFASRAAPDHPESRLPGIYVPATPTFEHPQP